MPNKSKRTRRTSRKKATKRTIAKVKRLTKSLKSLRQKFKAMTQECKSVRQNLDDSDTSNVKLRNGIQECNKELEKCKSMTVIEPPKQIENDIEQLTGKIKPKMKKKYSLRMNIKQTISKMFK